MKYSERLLLTWILALVALMFVSNEALAEHWQWKQLSARTRLGLLPPPGHWGQRFTTPSGIESLSSGDVLAVPF